MNPQTFILHVFKPLLRQNPALPMRAATTQKAVAKITAASIVLRTLASKANAAQWLATAALDQSSAYYGLEIPERATGVRYGSARKYARDAGGYVAVAIQAAIEQEFASPENYYLNNKPYSPQVYAHMIAHAFPLTWKAIQFVAFGELNTSEELELDDPLASAVDAEWEILHPLQDELLKLVELAADKYAIPYELNSPLADVKETYYDNCRFFYIPIDADAKRAERAACPNPAAMAEIPDEIPSLHIRRDKEWHLVDTLHRVGCQTGFGWYRSEDYDEDTFLFHPETLALLKSESHV